MKMGEVLAKSATALLIFGAAALLLALGGGNIDRIIVRIFIQFPLLMILAAISVFLINLAAALIGKVLLRQALVAALIAAFLGWAIAAPPEFAGLGYHRMLRPAFAIALAWPWVAGDLTGRTTRSRRTTSVPAQ
jgi:hypothetical protein